MRLSAKLSLIGIALISAITLALLSVYVERVGPELAQYGNLCGPLAVDPCYKPVLKGGFPVAYLFDAPGVSVERQLSFGEDKLFLGALILDITLYFAIVLLAIPAVSQRWSVLTHAANRVRT
ncbi:hypothetical protein [Massilia psychrophila]|jgi:hypothetical protein|uniref:Uncharacterized protein n=1 Tax=Massilia psychrophila TaxID=1603353 RepID=A0A2G8T6K4_9BURK|nr:hypothetical protein [Massilia psychrophila]PIL41644.1 hypothetical protein CR103_00950 [Massilia psychrophila]GGE61415.1 hypothetical protein GCM10008020_01960 [Massilia psychrophila]